MRAYAHAQYLYEKRTFSAMMGDSPPGVAFAPEKGSKGCFGSWRGIGRGGRGGKRRTFEEAFEFIHILVQLLRNARTGGFKGLLFSFCGGNKSVTLFITRRTEGEFD